MRSVKIDRIKLYQRIVRAARLCVTSPSKGYFSRNKLLELAIYIETQNETIEKLKEALNGRTEQINKEVS